MQYEENCMIDTVFLNEPGKNVAILMRHADRGRIISGVNEDEPLNELGIKNSIEFGKKLRRYDSVKIFTSPIGRCIRTGEAILQGIEKNGHILQSNMLGEPGPFVFDKELAKGAFKEFSTRGVVKNQIARVEMAGIRPLEEGCELLRSLIESEININAKNNLLIFITHDAIIVPFIHLYTGEMFDKEHWIAFSDGAIIMKDKENIQMNRNGKFYAMH
jgi:broad specificity phosphatase PhoE